MSAFLELLTVLRYETSLSNMIIVMLTIVN